MFNPVMVSCRYHWPVSGRFRKWVGTSFILSLLWVTAGCRSGQEANDEFSKIDKHIAEHSQAYASLKEATTRIGHRLTGTDNGASAESFVFNKLKSYGFDSVTFQPFEVNAWMRGTVMLSVKHEGQIANIPVVSLGQSPEKSNITARIVDMGNGLAEDYLEIGSKLEGQFALVYIGLPDSLKATHKNLHRSEKTKLALDHGAAGVIIYNQVPNGVLLTGTASVDGKVLPAPAVCIGYEDGVAIREMLTIDPSSVEGTLEMSNRIGPIKARNVIATIRGADLHEERIIIGGHLDSWDLATGAIDNGIGSFSVLDIARAFKANNLRPRRTIQFVFFMGEEQGLLGSRYFVKQSESTGSIHNIRLMINLDMTGNPIGMNIAGAVTDSAFFVELNAHIHRTDTVYEGLFSRRVGLHSDHQPFMLAGIPVLGMRSHMDPSIYHCYHADCDDINLVNPMDMINNVRVGTMILYALTNADPFPVRTMTSQETRDYMISNGLEDNLKMQGDWKW